MVPTARSTRSRETASYGSPRRISAARTAKAMARGIRAGDPRNARRRSRRGRRELAIAAMGIASVVRWSILPSLRPRLTIARWARLRASGATSPGEDAPRPPASAERTDTHTVTSSFLADVATGLWRMQTRISQLGTELTATQVRQLARQVDATHRVLAQYGIDIHSYEGTRFDSGMSIRAVAFQPVAGLDQERIIETLASDRVLWWTNHPARGSHSRHARQRCHRRCDRKRRRRRCS